MTSTFTPNKNLELPGFNDYVDSWNTPVNADFTAVDTALGGVTNLNATAASGDVTLTSTQYRPLQIIISGTLTANVRYLIPSSVGGQWTVTNSTSGAFTVKIASAAGGSDITLPSGTTMVSCDGTSGGMRLSNSGLNPGGSTGYIQFNNSGLFDGSADLFWDITNSRLGVGTSAPASELSVSNSSSVQIQATTGTVDFRIQSIDAFSAAYSGTVSNHDYVFTTNNLNRMRIDTSGNVGIGTSSPSSTLDVNGTITGRAVGAEGGQIQLNNPTNLSTGLVVDVATADVGRIFSSSSNFVLQLGQIGGGTGGIVSLYTATIERMRIDASGNVGIGTTSPGSKLEVNQGILTINASDQSLARLQLKNTGTSGRTWELVGGLPGTDNVNFSIYDNTAAATRLTIGSSGQLGIGGANYGTSGQVLTSNGSAAAPSWQTAAVTGTLKNVQVFTSSGTYTRTSGVTTAVVIAVGGGGGGGGSTINGGTGGTTSFGSHVAAVGGSGGTAATSGSPGDGGTGGTGATIAIKGAPGGYSYGNGCIDVGGIGGGQGGGKSTTAGVRGAGGGGTSGVNRGPGGGQGETGIKYTTTVGATETVTIGAGGTAGAGAAAGGAGYIIVYEYS